MQQSASPLPLDLPTIRIALAKTTTSPQRRSLIAIVGFAVVSALFFVGGETLSGSSEWEWIIALLGALLFHELGHFAAMRHFGYRDLRIFFIPFFGAAATGKKRAATGLEEALVLLAGPVPGIALGSALLLIFDADAAAGSWIMAIAAMLIAVNLFNLLPAAPLDGGRFLDRVIFCRHPAWQRAVRIGGGLLLLAAAYVLESWVLGLVALSTFLSLSTVLRTARAGRIIRADFDEETLAQSTIPDECVERVSAIVAEQWSDKSSQVRAETFASLMVNAWEEAGRTPVDRKHVAWLMVLYFGAIFLPFVAFALAVFVAASSAA